MKRIIFMALGAALPLQAFAWNHTGHVWSYDDMPIPYWVAEFPSYSGLDNKSGVDNYQSTVIQNGYTAWREAAPCADFRAVFVDFDGMPVSEPHPPTFTWPNLPSLVLETTEENESSEFTGSRGDGMNWNSFDDPKQDIAEPGTLAVTFTNSSVQTIERFIDGEPYNPAFNSDIVFNDNTAFTTDELINAGDCGGATGIQGVATHEIGHLIGLDHSCEREDICPDAVLRNATMYWSGGPCDTEPSIPSTDDIDSINALYGPFASFVCSHELDPDSTEGTIAFGVVPFELKCAVSSENPAEITTATWNWGDGGTSTEINGTHEYTEDGNYTVTVCFEGQRDSCADGDNPGGEWESCTRRTGYVRACDIPDVEFTYEPVEGLTYQLLNETDISTYGCIFDVQWDIFAGASASGEPIDSKRAWEPQFTFDEAGTYTVVLNVGGPGGTAAAELTFEARNTGSKGACDNAGTSGTGFAMLIGGLALFGRRKKQQ